MIFGVPPGLMIQAGKSAYFIIAGSKKLWMIGEFGGSKIITVNKIRI